MLYIVDIESDGPCPGLYSMISFGAIRVDSKLQTWFYGKTKPLPGASRLEEAAKVSNTSRELHESYHDPKQQMIYFRNWVLESNTHGKPVFISDNPAFDWQFINYYFNLFSLDNPFGFSARRIGDFYCGLKNDWYKSNEWKKFRKTKHTHNPVDDARGNAEALIEICNKFKIELPGIP